MCLSAGLSSHPHICLCSCSITTGPSSKKVPVRCLWYTTMTEVEQWASLVVGAPAEAQSPFCSVMYRSIQTSSWMYSAGTRSAQLSLCHGSSSNAHPHVAARNREIEPQLQTLRVFSTLFLRKNNFLNPLQEKIHYTFSFRLQVIQVDKKKKALCAYRSSGL